MTTQTITRVIIPASAGEADRSEQHPACQKTAAAATGPIASAPAAGEGVVPRSPAWVLSPQNPPEGVLGSAPSGAGEIQ